MNHSLLSDKMRWRVLNLADVSSFPGVLDELNFEASVVTLPASQEILMHELPNFDAYLCALSVRLTSDLVEKCPDLRVVATPSTGWDHVDVGSLERQGIQMVSLRGEEEFLNSITATAELAWGLLLAVVRRLRMATRLAMSGVWARDACRGVQLSGKTLGVLGYGRLGRILAEYAHAFRMRVLVCDVKPIVGPAWVEAVSLEELLAKSDVVSVHVHLTPETRGLLSTNEFAAMKPGAILINTSRGAVINESCLLEALQSGHLAGAGLDVIDGEWDNAIAGHPLIAYAREHENLIITPHVGGITYDSQRAAYIFIARKLASALRALDPRSSRDDRQISSSSSP